MYQDGVTELPRGPEVAASLLYKQLEWALVEPASFYDVLFDATKPLLIRGVSVGLKLHHFENRHLVPRPELYINDVDVVVPEADVSEINKIPHSYINGTPTFLFGKRSERDFLIPSTSYSHGINSLYFAEDCSVYLERRRNVTVDFMVKFSQQLGRGGEATPIFELDEDGNLLKPQHDLLRGLSHLHETVDITFGNRVWRTSHPEADFVSNVLQLPNTIDGKKKERAVNRAIASWGQLQTGLFGEHFQLTDYELLPGFDIIRPLIISHTE